MPASVPRTEEPLAGLCNVLFPFKEVGPAEVFEANTAAGVTVVLLLALGPVGGVVAIRLLRRGGSETEAKSEEL